MCAPMRPDHLAGTSIPRFTYDTPTTPGNDFYDLCAGPEPLAMIFLPSFDHPITREYISRYIKTLPDLKGVRLACVVRSSPRQVAQTLEGRQLPFTLICDRPGVLYNFLGVETAGLLNWSFEAQRIIRSAQSRGLRYDRKAPQLLPLTLVIGREGAILFTHYGRSLTDMPGDCGAICSLCDEVAELTAARQGAPAAPRRAKAGPHSDETLTLPDLAGDLTGELPHLAAAPPAQEEDAIGKLFD